LIIAWGIWLAWNHSLFEGGDPSPLHCALSSLVILPAYPQSLNSHPSILSTETVISKDIPWVFFFYGVAQGIPSLGGTGGVVFLSEDQSISFLVGQDTNNYSEVLVLKFTLLLPKEKGISQISIYGNS